MKENLHPLAKFIKDGAFLVDVRSTEEFQSGSVKGAINIPLQTIPLNMEKFKDKEHIIVFCQSGGRSGQAKHFLIQNGIENVMNGGSWYEVDMAMKQIPIFNK